MTDVGVETGVYAVTSAEYIREALSLWIARWWWVLPLPLIPFLVLGFWLGDVRWFMVALMVVFIIIPMGLSLVYFDCLLSPEVRLSLLPKRVAVSTDGLRVTYQPEKADAEPRPAELIPASEVSATLFRPRFLVYRLRRRGSAMLLIPYKALPAGVTRAALTI
ncbi:MAG: hypothetical protein K2H87_04135 [Duncaniella sp.]|nr:hypothetical protein [Duncaniella sp.]